MRIFNWVHRKFRPNQHDYDYGVKDPSDANSHGPPSESCLDERAKRVRISQEVKVEDSNRRDKNYSNVNEDAQALLGPRRSKVSEMFSKWQNGLLTIGTFGIDQNDEGYVYGYESLDVEDIFLKETEDEELINSIEVEVFEGKLEEVFGLKNENYFQVKDLKSQKWQNKGSITELKGSVKEYSASDIHKENSGHDSNTNSKNNGNNIYPLQEFFEVPLLAGTMTKKEHRTTLADLFSRSKNYTTSNMLDDAPKIEFETEFVEKKKNDLSLGKSGRSLIKNVLKWKKGGNLHRPKQWMKKMLNKKIYPESAAAELHASEVIGHLDVSKTYINASKINDMDTENSCEDGKGSLTNGSPSELASLLRDASKGSQECWIKTDSE
ncbi:hypothetical protein KI387_035178, partial [Taxus chinensis]